MLNPIPLIAASATDTASTMPNNYLKIDQQYPMNTIKTHPQPFKNRKNSLSTSKLTSLLLRTKRASGTGFTMQPPSSAPPKCHSSTGVKRQENASSKQLPAGNPRGSGTEASHISPTGGHSHSILPHVLRIKTLLDIAIQFNSLL